MKRRDFLGLGLGAAALTLAPVNVFAKDYRKELPDVWKIKNNEKDANDEKPVMEAVKKIFGTDKVEEGQIKLKAPDIAENGAVVPVSFKLEKAKKIALFQTANPECLVAIWDIPEVGIPDYAVRIKLKKTGKVIVVADVDGKIYKVGKNVKVTAGGCGG